MQNKIVKCGKINISNKNLFTLIAGPCQLENENHAIDVAGKLKEITEKNGYVLLTTPIHGYYKNLLISLLNLNDKHYTPLWKHGHIKFFSVKTFKELVRISGTNLEIK